MSDSKDNASNSRVNKGNLARDRSKVEITASSRRPNQRASNSRAEGLRVKVQQKFEITLPKARRARASQQTGSTSGATGGEEEHMNSVEYYQEVARRQYATLNQECNALKRDPSVYEQCQTYAKSIRDKITGMAEQQGAEAARGQTSEAVDL